MTIIKKFDTSKIDKPRSVFHFSKKFIILSVISILILVIVEVWASNTVVTFGDRLERISALQQSLRMENQILENEIAKKSALVNIASDSAMLGFSKPSQVQYIR